MTLLIAFLLFVITLGKITDIFLFKDEKTKLYKIFDKYDKVIDNTKTPNLHKLIIDKTLLFFNKYFNFRKNLFKSLFITILISWLATSLINIPYQLFGINHKTLNIREWHDVLPWYPTYIINFIFDFLTIVITLKILKLIRNKSLKKIIGWISIDLTIAYILVYLCYNTLGYTNSYLYLNTDFLTQYHSGANLKVRKIKEFDFTYLAEKGYKIDTVNFSENAKIKILPSSKLFSKSEIRYFNIMLYYYALPLNQKWITTAEPFTIIISDNTKESKFQVKIGNHSASIQHDLFIYSLTSFIPTFSFLLILFLTIIYKKLFTVFRFISSRYIKSNIEDVTKDEIEKFKPGTHLAITITLFVSLIKLIKEVIKYLI